MSLITPGTYKFKIISVEPEYVSKAGNISIKLILEIKDSTGQPYKLFEYLTKKNDPKTNLPYAFIVKKTHDLLDAIGKPQLKDAQLNANDLLNAEGWASIKTEESNEYPPSLKVARFVVPKDKQQEDVFKASLTAQAPMPVQETIKPFPDEDIPF